MKNFRYFFEYLKDKNVALYKKLLIGGSLLYFILPVDIVPDYILGIGWLDDAAVAAFIWNALSSEIRDYAAKKRAEGSKIISFEDKRRNK